MTSHRILQLDAVSTAACRVGMLATRGTLHSFFGLDTPPSSTCWRLACSSTRARWHSPPTASRSPARS